MSNVVGSTIYSHPNSSKLFHSPKGEDGGKVNGMRRSTAGVTAGNSGSCFSSPAGLSVEPCLKALLTPPSTTPLRLILVAPAWL